MPLPGSSAGLYLFQVPLQVSISSLALTVYVSGGGSGGKVGGEKQRPYSSDLFQGLSSNIELVTSWILSLPSERPDSLELFF